MRAGRSRPVLDIAQFALAPKLAGHVVRLSAVLQELARKSPVPVIFEPCGKPVFVTDFAHAAYIFVRHGVGHHPAHIPQKTIRSFGASDHDAFEHRQKRHRIVSVTFFEPGDEIVRKILPAGFVAILHHHFERPAVGLRNPLKNLTDKSVEMGTDMLPVHFVDLQPRSLRGGGTVRNARGSHSGTQDRPLPGRDVPCQHTVPGGYELRDIPHGGRIDRQRRIVRFGRSGPKVVLPVRQRSLVHFSQAFFAVTFDPRRCRKFHLAQGGGSAGIIDRKAERPGRRGRERDRNGSINIEPDIGHFVEPTDIELRHRPVVAPVQSLEDGIRYDRAVFRAYGNAAGGKKLRRLENDRGFPDGEPDGRKRIPVDQPSDTGQSRYGTHRSGRVVQQHSIVFRHRIGDHAHVLNHPFGLRQPARKLRRALDPHLRTAQITHRLFRLHPGTAGLTPPRRVENADLHIQFRCGLEGRMQYLPPRLAHQLDRPVRNVVVTDVADIGAVDSGCFHRSQVFGYTFFRYVSGNPIPIRTDFYRIGRGDESPFEHGRSNGSRIAAATR